MGSLSTMMSSAKVALREPEFRVAMVLESVYPSIGGGGAESQIGTLSVAMRERGTLEIITPLMQPGPQIEREEVLGVSVYRIPYPRISKIGAAILALKLAKHLVVSRKSYDVIHCHIANNMAAVASVTGKILGKKTIVKMTGGLELDDGILSTNNSIANRLRRMAIRLCDTCIATSRELELKLLEFDFHRDRVSLIPNAVDCERFSPSLEHKRAFRETLGIKQNAKVALAVGRLVEEKSLDLLLKAWSQTIPPTDDHLLLLVGDGALRQPLEELAKQLNLESQVRFLGSHREVERFYKVADYYVIPSRVEGLSNALLEAMASGLPTIGSRISGTEDLIEWAQAGWLFPPGDLEELKRCLAAIVALDDAELIALGKKTRARLMEYASVDVVTDRLLQTYKN